VHSLQVQEVLVHACMHLVDRGERPNWKVLVEVFNSAEACSKAELGQATKTIESDLTAWCTSVCLEAEQADDIYAIPHVVPNTLRIRVSPNISGPVAIHGLLQHRTFPTQRYMRIVFMRILFMK
jgi:hypothetical protein